MERLFWFLTEWAKYLLIPICLYIGWQVYQLVERLAALGVAR